jgi:hypothetical protein
MPRVAEKTYSTDIYKRFDTDPKYSSTMIQTAFDKAKGPMDVYDTGLLTKVRRTSRGFTAEVTLGGDIWTVKKSVDGGPKNRLTGISIGTTATVETVSVRLDKQGNIVEPLVQ